VTSKNKAELLMWHFVDWPKAKHNQIVIYNTKRYSYLDKKTFM